MELIHNFEEYVNGLAINSDDTLFIANDSTNSIDRVTIVEGKVSILKSPNNQFTKLKALAFDNHGDLFVGNEGKIMKMSKEGIVSNFVGNGKEGSKDGEGMNAKLSDPYGICFDESGFAYFCDYNNHSIRKVTPEGKVTTICGSNSGKRGFKDGKGNEALFDGPWGIVYNKFTKIFYITDNGNKKIRTMTLDGTVRTPWKYSAYLYSIAIDPGGNLYVYTWTEGVITVNTKGEIKQIPNTKFSEYIYSYGMAFNSKGDLFFTMNKTLTFKSGQLFMIRKTNLPSFSQSIPSPTVLSVVTDINKNNKGKSGKEEEMNELTKWLHDMQLEEIESILREELGVSNLRLLITIEENDLNGLQIKPIPKKRLLQDIQKLKNSNSNSSPLHNDVHL